MPKLVEFIPEADGDEALYLSELLAGFSIEKATKFARFYRTRRKQPQSILLLCLLGFLGIAGIHRFVLNQTGMGLLYFLTSGLCFIGTFVDIINYKTLTFEYNRKIAADIAELL